MTKALVVSLLSVVLFHAAFCQSVSGQQRGIHLSTPLSPPAWALLERELLRANTAACEEFFAKYFDERGFLLCVERWGGDDGPDDAIENCNDWPLLHALGAPDVIRHGLRESSVIERQTSHEMIRTSDCRA